jgi:3-oxoacyl-[acyl-carrier protein] reductase
MRFEGKKILVTGASSGIGYASAVLMAKEGGDIAFTYNKNKDGADKLLAEIESFGRKAYSRQVNMTDDEEITALAAWAHEQCGPFDVLFNNAGGLVERMPFFEIRKEKWDEIQTLNVWSCVRLSQLIGEKMKQNGGGVIVHNSSVAGRFGGGKGAAAYSVAKGAMITLTKSMGKELIEDGIRVNGIAPGIIDTPFHEHFTPKEVMQGLMKNVPIGRPGRSDEMAKIVAFLASDDSSYLVGATIDSNGGMWVV